MLPNFIIIGAMKGGTTSLYRYIASHPDIIPSSSKETDFFKTSSDFNKGIDWYQNLFYGNGEYAFEASPNYTKRHLFPDVPARMYSILPDAKLIYVLRDPIERIVSHYVHNYARGRESRAFSQVVKDTSSNYIQTSKYYFQIQAFLEYYSDRQLLILESEQLNKYTTNVLSIVFRFLGISANYDPTLLEERFHESSDKKRLSRLERSLCRRTNNPYLLASIRKITKPWRQSIERPTLSPKDRQMLVEEIAPDIEKLRQFTGLTFSDWSL